MSPAPPRSTAIRRLAPALLIAAMVSAMVSAAAPVRAQTGQDNGLLAESLFREGRRLMQAQNYAEGCPKLEESNKLDPAPGTLLALATCYEAQGRVASAWGEFTQSLATARRDGRADREAFAREHIAKLEPLIPKITIDVPPASRVAGLEVTRNGAPITEPSWGVALPSDPGSLVVTASAPGHKPWTFKTQVQTSQVLHVAVPVLDDAPAPLPAPLPATASPAAATGSLDGSVHILEPTRPAPARHDYRVAAYIAGGLGIASLAVGTYFGVSALSKQRESDSGCPVVNGARACTQAGVDASSAALTSAHIADVTIGAGLAAVAVGVVLFALSTPHAEGAGADTPAATPPTAALRLRLSPSVDPRGAGAVLLGTF